MRQTAIFLPSLGGGGAERVLLHLCRGFLDAGVDCDLVTGSPSGNFESEADSRARLVDLQAGHVLQCVAPLARYLRRERPGVLLSAQTHANLAALAAGWISSSHIPIVISEHTTLSINLRSSRRWKDHLMGPLVRVIYPSASGIAAVSRGAAEDLAANFHLDASRVRVLHNPLPLDEIQRLSLEPAGHPWLDERAIPVILAVGRLEPEKGFDLLLEAFARLRGGGCLARLVIQGDGSQRGLLTDLALRLGVCEDVDLPGYNSNPYASMRRCSLFALSSRYEGFPMALVEALACGAPAVSVDCRSGPREIIGERNIGILCPPGDAAALARALDEGLSRSFDANAMRLRVLDFSLENTAQDYLRLLSEAQSAYREKQLGR